MRNSCWIPDAFATHGFTRHCRSLWQKWGGGTQPRGAAAPVLPILPEAAREESGHCHSSAPSRDLGRFPRPRSGVFPIWEDSPSPKRTSFWNNLRAGNNPMHFSAVENFSSKFLIYHQLPRGRINPVLHLQPPCRVRRKSRRPPDCIVAKMPRRPGASFNPRPIINRNSVLRKFAPTSRRLLLDGGSMEPDVPIGRGVSG